MNTFCPVYLELVFRVFDVSFGTWLFSFLSLVCVETKQTNCRSENSGILSLHVTYS